jgi:hypothetical protein
MHALAFDEMPGHLTLGVIAFPKDNPGKIIATQKARVRPSLAKGGWGRGEVIPTFTGVLATPAADAASGVNEHGFTHGLIPLIRLFPG